MSLSRASNRELILYCLVLLLLPTELGKHFWPSYTLIQGFRVDYLSPTLYVTDVLLALLFFHWVIRIFISRQFRISALLSYLLVLLFLSLTVLQAAYVGPGLYNVAKAAEFLFFGWYTAEILREKETHHIVARLFAVGIIGESLLAVLQVLNQGSLNGLFYWLGERSFGLLTPGVAAASVAGRLVLRPYATFSHPNVLAGYLLLGMTFLLFPFKQKPWWVWLAVAFGSFGLFLTLSRVAIGLWLLVLLLSFFSEFWSQRQRLKSLIKQRQKFLVAIFIFLLLLLPLLPTVITRFTGTNTSEEAFIVREDLNSWSYHLWQQHPLLGVGLGNFLFYSPSKVPTGTSLYLTVQPVHNIFLLVLAETGVLGFMLFLWLLVRSFFHADQWAKVLLVLVLLLGATDHYFLTLQQGQLLLSFVLGLCWITQDYPSKTS